VEGEFYYSDGSVVEDDYIGEVENVGIIAPPGKEEGKFRYKTVTFGGVIVKEPFLKDGEYVVELTNRSWKEIKVVMGNVSTPLDLNFFEGGRLTGMSTHRTRLLSEIMPLLSENKMVLFEFVYDYPEKYLNPDIMCNDPTVYDVCSRRLYNIGRSLEVFNNHDAINILKEGGRNIKLYYPQVVSIN
jgi:hypothetical protein